MCSGFPESLVRGLLRTRAPGWPPGLGEECREMKDGSFLRLPKEAASSRRDGSSWSEGKGEQEGEGEEGEAAAAFDGKGEAEANTLEEGGGEDGATALQEGELGICLVGRWAAEGFLGPWPAGALLLGVASLGPGAADAAALWP
jgi:hypothetical protein